MQLQQSQIANSNFLRAVFTLSGKFVVSAPTRPNRRMLPRKFSIERSENSCLLIIFRLKKFFFQQWRFCESFAKTPLLLPLPQWRHFIPPSPHPPPFSFRHASKKKKKSFSQEEKRKFSLNFPPKKMWKIIVDEN